MAEVFVKHSSGVIAGVIFVLLVISVGLLVFLLKSQVQTETTPIESVTSHINASPESTNTPTPRVSSRTVVTRSTDVDTDTPQTTEDPFLDTVPWEHFRLPKYVLPLHYELVLHPDIENGTFSGAVNITVNLTRTTQSFVAHAYRLVIRDSKVYRGATGDEKIGVDRSFLYDPHEYVVVKTNSRVQPGSYRLHFSFTGSLVGSIVGFYKSKYTNGNNETRYLATSKFQPTYARRAFPCFDEPSFKSTFTVSLVHEPEYIALSNMPVENTEQYKDQLLITKFQKSVPMVTYLACFIVCDFKYRGMETTAGKEFRVYSTPDQVNKTVYALKFGLRVLEYFENYFGIDYPLPKQDMVSIPDFVSGAMEHWGVITFRETNLLYDRKQSNPQNKQRISAVISHEMAHMWFGNLVTMEWWDDLWLNEGFASYVEYKGVHEQHPDWDMLSQFVTEDVQPVMDLDSTMSSHPIVQPVTHPDEITEIFDDISYGKGASVLRMLEFFVGEQNFRKGISQFLKKHQYKNANTADLWQELSEACGYQGNHSITSIMSTWTQQMGFPYVTIQRRGNSFTARQNRFVKNEALQRQANNVSAEYVWSIPLSYTTSSGKSGIIWIHDTKEVNFTLPIGDSDWIKFNVNQTGYYIVNYEIEEWNRLIELLKTNHEALTPADRSNLLFDTFLLAEAGHIRFDVFLSMSMYLKKETHLIPWETAYASFVYLCQLLEYTDVNTLLKSYIKDITYPLYKKLRWKMVDDHLDNLLRMTIIGLACHSGNEDCLSGASELFQNWTRGQEITPTLKNLVFHYGMSEIGREEHWNYMWAKYLQEESPSERKSLLYGLAHVRLPYLIHRYLEYATDDSKIRRQDFFTILSYISGNPVGRPFVWNFIRSKWPALVERFTLNDRYLGLTVKKICSYFTSDYELREMKSFFAKYPDAGAGKRRRHQALENVQNNIRWLKTYKEDVKSWLQMEGTIPWYYHRLPTYIVPEHYDLKLTVLLDQDTFSGSVSILVTLNRRSDVIIIHAVDLDITKTDVTSLDGDRSVFVDDVFPYGPNEYWVIKMEDKLDVGKYKVELEFEANLTESLKGLYKSSYVDIDTNEKQFLAVTQFEPAYARRAFPCFDEPMFRSTFNVTVIHNSSYFALSNTKVDETVGLSNGLTETTFEKTLPMATYLLAVIVCDFKYKEVVTANGLRIRVYAAPHNYDKMDYALEESEKIITFFENYFDVPLPLKKLDMAAIPDMANTGMENWGLITYSEGNLLWDNTSSTLHKSGTDYIISHEVAHMWFGDLVSLQWWDELWLKEGFASYVSRKAVDHSQPNWTTSNDFLIYSVSMALQEDGSVNSHPVVQPIRKVADIVDMFDFISYSKGASLLNMLENFMGDDFKTGVSAYLKKFSFKSARTGDLWNALTDASRDGYNITVIMDTWTKQMNYPYIAVKRDPEDKTAFYIQQHRFLHDLDSKMVSATTSPYNYVWQIPLSYITADNRKAEYVLVNSSEIVRVALPKSKWIKFNSKFTGFYLVNYEKEEWIKFTNLLRENLETLPVTDRYNLLFDSLTLASANLLEYEVPLNMTLYLKNETEYEPLHLAADFLDSMKLLFRNNRDVKQMLKEHVRSLVKEHLKKYTWDDSGDYNKRRIRSLLIRLCCGNSDHDCLITAGTYFKQWMNGNASLNISTYTSQVYFYGMQIFNDEKTWNYLWQRYLSEHDVTEKRNLMRALANVRNETLIERLINYVKDENAVRLQEYLFCLSRIANNPKGHFAVVHFIFYNWDYLAKRFPDKTEIEEFSSSVFGDLFTERELKMVQNFYKKYPVEKTNSIYRARAIENIKRNIKWLKTHSKTIENWLNHNVDMPWKSNRLPRHVKPTLYDLKIHLNISQATFKGAVNITLNVTEDTRYILVHQKDLKITETELAKAESGKKIQTLEMFPFRRNHYWVIRFEENIPAGIYMLKMKFSGVFSTKDRGLRRVKYKLKDDKEEKYMVTTQFEPTEARTAFPCFDEPDMKSKIKLTIVHEGNYTALSNMPEQSRNRLRNSLVETTFEESVAMSTYLLCWVLTDFEFLEADYKGKIIRAYAPADRLRKAEHGLNMTVKMLEKYENYFGVPYSLPKLDSVSIPEDGWTAMEHWGIITYQEARFLVDDSLSANEVLRKVDQVIAHELAHQWFGNLVTMKWWNDIWLNEGFSTFAMHISLEPFYPESEEQNVWKMTRVLREDSTIKSHPIVHNSTEIKVMFDQISYQKGGAVLRMLQSVLKDDFRKGVSNYLKKYAFKNAETKDLWRELSEASRMDVNISEVMNTWTNQMGFPYVKIKRSNGSFTATQEWFLSDVNDSVNAALLKKSPHGYVWKIPLTCKDIESGKEYNFWLNNKSATFQVNVSRDRILKFNPGFVGFYIIEYDDEGWAQLKERLLRNHEDFSVIDRFNLIHDAFLLAEAGNLLYDVPLELTKYLKNERELLPWKIFRENLFSEHLDETSETMELFKKYLRELSREMYDQNVGASNGGSYFKKWQYYRGSCQYIYAVSNFSTIIADIGCYSYHPKFLNRMNDELQMWLRGENTTSNPTLVTAIGVRYFGNDSVWERLHNKLTSSNVTAGEEKLLLHALSSFKEPHQIKRTLEMMMSDPAIDSRMAKDILYYLSKNPYALYLTWNYAKFNWNALQERLDVSNHPSHVLDLLCPRFKTKDYLREVIMFFKDHPEIHPISVRECLEDIQEDVNWSDKFEETILSWLRWNVPK